MSTNQHIESLHEIRSLMERSTRFISLSGLSGVLAGVAALLGAWVAKMRIDAYWKDGMLRMHRWDALVSELMLIAGSVLVAAIAVAYYFTWRKAKKDGTKVWTKMAGRILINLAIPLGTGGMVVLFMLHYHQFILVAPFMLIFYGLACVNASHNTVSDIKYLGVTVVLVGLLNLLYLGHGLLFWSIGFGVLHILYGLIMYLKYERKKS